ncbi:hypothetical protein ScPMuIL_018780 [Solemya velum]
MMNAVCVFVVVFLVTTQGKPTLDKSKLAGPCIGMDCLHGILMHGDDHIGEDHAMEDTYEMMKDKLETGKKEIGPKDAIEMFHGVLMHGDKDAGEHHDHVNKDDFGPEKPAEIKPQLIDEEMHGVLMHGDTEIGHNHKHEDEKLQESDNTAPVNPKTADVEFHGVLMHGDERGGIDHADEDEELRKEDKTAPDSPKNAEEEFHGVLMHGDKKPGEDHTHEDATAHAQDMTEKGEAGPRDAESLMHGGKTHVHDEKDEPKEIEMHAPDGPDPNDLHGILMHGDSEVGHDHTLEDILNQEPAAKFDIEEIKKLGLDKDLLKNLNIDELLKEDKKNFKEWQDHQAEEGWSAATVSDSILDNIRLLRDRYIYKTETDDNDDSDEKNENAKDDRLLFDAGRDSYDKNQEYIDYSSEPHEHEDSDHDLELAGNTDPFNKRHEHFKGRRDHDIL